jgi:hypothetical protein
VWELDAHGAGSTVVRLGELPPGWTEVVPLEEVPPGRSIVVRVVTSDRTYVNVADPDALADDRLEVMDVYMTPDRFDANRAEECRRFHGPGLWSQPTTWVLAGLFGVMVLALGIGLTWGYTGKPIVTSCPRCLRVRIVEAETEFGEAGPSRA